jgi:aminopeptidase N
MKCIAILFCYFLGLLGFAQQTKYVDFIEVNALLVLNPDSTKVSGLVAYDMKTIKPVDSVFIDAKNMTFPGGIAVNDKKVSYTNDGDRLWIYKSFKKDSSYRITFNYDCYPKQALYFLKRKEDWNIWTQGQGKYTSHWLPSFDDVNEKVIFKIGTAFKEGYEILSNGKRLQGSQGKGVNSGVYVMQNPMSSYLVALAIGKYNKKTETSASGIPLEYYYYPEDSLKVEPTYRYSKRMFDFLEAEIGFPYPWQNYKQVPVHDFLYAGMENTSLTIFSDAFVVDSIGFNDKNYVNVNAHELAHQWFGDLVTAKSGEHHWLQEGFATYYALLAERDIFGDDYYHFKLFESAVDLGRQDFSGDGTSLLNPKSSSLTFYQRGAWVLHALRSAVGDAVFKRAVRSYLEKHQFKNVQTSDFITEVERLYGPNLNGFKQKWIVAEAFPFDDAIALLQRQSDYVKDYMTIDCSAKSSKCVEYLKYYASDDVKIRVISQVPELVTNDTFNHGLRVRQAIAQYVKQIPKALKTNYETLLRDSSYLTIESALYNLWVNFPEDRPKYLAATRGIYGFSDMNVRLLWIVLNLSTPFYEADNKQQLYQELVGYTGSEYNAALRMNAFRYLKMISSCNETCLSNLELAKSHHNWQLVKFAKEMTEQLQGVKN